MKKEKIIVIEGLQGSGKTWLARYIKQILGASNLYHLAGTSDNTITGLYKSRNMHINLLKYIKTLEGCSLNLIFDRIFITEQVYSQIGYKDYDFTSSYNNLLKDFYGLDFEIILILLTITDIKELARRLGIRILKTDVSRKGLGDSEYNVSESIKQQNEYIKTFNKLPESRNVQKYIIDNSYFAAADFIKNLLTKG